VRNYAYISAVQAFAWSTHWWHSLTICDAWQLMPFGMYVFEMHIMQIALTIPDDASHTWPAPLGQNWLKQPCSAESSDLALGVAIDWHMKTHAGVVQARSHVFSPTQLYAP